MKKSIRFKLFLAFGGLVVFFVILSWILTNGFLDKYYTHKKKNILLDTTNKIEEIYNKNSEDVLLEFEKIERNNGIHINIFTEDKELKYTSSFKLFTQKEQRKMGDLRKIQQYNFSNVLPGRVYLSISKDPVLGTNFINSAYILSNGDYLFLSTPLEAINESAKIASQFYIFIGLLTIVLGSLIAYFFSKKITNPILELKTIAQGMSNLDFSKKYIVESQDEIGELGNSINSLSDQLDQSITELRVANVKLSEDIARKEKVDKMRKEFVSNVSHELKTPISLIQGYAEGLKVNVVDDEDSKDYYCDVIIDEANKMNKMVVELLDLSKIESGYLELNKEVFNISELIGEILNKYSPIFKEKSINIEFQKSEDFYVFGDIEKIDQVLSNYLNNAINHINYNRDIKVSIILNGERARISVFNTGDAIADQFIENIWQSFYKLDKARTRDYGGTGLGLSIVRAIMQLHQNDYGVMNKENGVEFWFELDTKY